MHRPIIVSRWWGDFYFTFFSVDFFYSFFNRFSSVASRLSIRAINMSCKQLWKPYSRAYARAHTLQFCTFCFHNLHTYLCKSFLHSGLSTIFEHYFTELWLQHEIRAKRPLEKGDNRFPKDDDVKICLSQSLANKFGDFWAFPTFLGHRFKTLRDLPENVRHFLL